MRIVGGEFRGRPLATPSGRDIRPTSDRLRETLFDILAHGMHRHGLSNPVDGARVLDLFAGTGALALEALSRGAAMALLVEEGAEARGLIRQNIETLGLTGRTHLYRRDATRLGPASSMKEFSLVFADPPYGRGLGEAAIASALAGGWLASAALIALEESAASPVNAPDGFDLLESRTIGDSAIHLMRVSPAAAEKPKTEAPPEVTGM